MEQLDVYSTDILIIYTLIINNLYTQDNYLEALCNKISTI